MAMLSRSLKSPQLHRQLGLSLIEVLIALLVLSIGMVGMGALMLVSLTNVHSSSHHSLASALALDLEERLWFEVAHRSADNPGSLVNGCLSENQIQAVVTAMADQWAQGNANWAWIGNDSRRLVVSDLQVDFDDVNPEPSAGPTNSAGNAAIQWKSVPLTITWQEARFDDLDGDRDAYAARITVPCRPVFD